MVSEDEAGEDIVTEPHSKVLARAFSVLRSSCPSMLRSRMKDLPGTMIIRVPFNDHW